MNTSRNVAQFQKHTVVQTLNRLVVAIAIAGFSVTAQAGKITSIPTSDVGVVQDRFGGLDFTNVDVILNGALSTFDELTGAYSFSVDSKHTYEARVYDDENQTTLLGKVLAKDWPVGEPAGIKVVNDDFDAKRTTNCIMSTSYLDGYFLDTADPKQVLCSGPFQSHKRYKLAMLPTSIDGLGQEGIDLVFNVEAEVDAGGIPTSRDYQVFQKINNWTDERLAGFTIKVGTGQGASFVPASDLTAGVGVENLSLSVPVAVWDRADQNANFSSGLFGPKDMKHGRPHGFFDPDTRAGFVFNEYGAGNTGDASGQIDTLTSGAKLGSDYPDVPAGAGAAAGQFGNWLPNNMLPFGIFFDDDANPDTDNLLVAWYGWNPNLTVPGLGWMTGTDPTDPPVLANSFLVVDPATITNVWGVDPLYSMGVIDDLVNVGLNYNVTVADISSFPGYNADPALNAATFTIRITPVAETIATADPDYKDQIPVPTLTYTSTDAIITLDPSPEFVPGSSLTVRVADADENASNTAIDTITVNVTTNDGSVAAATLTLDEMGLDRGVFVASLPGEFSNVAPGTIVTVEYNDLLGGAGGTIEPQLISAFSTAAGSLPAGTLQFNPASYTVAEDDGSVTVTVERINGSAGDVTVEYQTVSGSAIGSTDYVPDTATLFFLDTETSKTITVVLLNDTVAEPEKNFTILLSNAQNGASLGADSTATITLTDADIVTPVFTGTKSDGLFSFSWMTVGLVVIGLLGRARRKTS